MNVGGRNRIPMAELRSALMAQGLNDVQTLAASGNVIMTTGRDDDSLGRLVEETVSTSFNVVTRCITVRPAELRVVLDDPATAPGSLDPGRQLFIVLPAAPAEPLVRAWPIEDCAGDDAIMLGRFVVQRCEEGISNAPALVPFIERRWETIATGRNRRTMEALLERAR